MYERKEKTIVVIVLYCVVLSFDKNLMTKIPEKAPIILIELNCNGYTNYVGGKDNYL